MQALAEWYKTEGPKLTEKLKARGKKAPAVKSDRERQKLEEHAEWDFLREQGVAEKNLPALTSQAVRCPPPTSTPRALCCCCLQRHFVAMHVCPERPTVTELYSNSHR